MFDAANALKSIGPGAADRDPLLDAPTREPPMHDTKVVIHSGAMPVLLLAAAISIALALTALTASRDETGSALTAAPDANGITGAAWAAEPEVPIALAAATFGDIWVASRTEDGRGGLTRLTYVLEPSWAYAIAEPAAAIAVGERANIFVVQRPGPPAFDSAALHDPPGRHRANWPLPGWAVALDASRDAPQLIAALLAPDGLDGPRRSIALSDGFGAPAATWEGPNHSGDIALRDDGEVYVAVGGDTPGVIRYAADGRLIERRDGLAGPATAIDAWVDGSIVLAQGADGGDDSVQLFDADALAAGEPRSEFAVPGAIVDITFAVAGSVAVLVQPDDGGPRWIGRYDQRGNLQNRLDVVPALGPITPIPSASPTPRFSPTPTAGPGRGTRVPPLTPPPTPAAKAWLPIALSNLDVDELPGHPTVPSPTRALASPTPLPNGPVNLQIVRAEGVTGPPAFATLSAAAEQSPWFTLYRDGTYIRRPRHLPHLWRFGKMDDRTYDRLLDGYVRGVRFFDLPAENRACGPGALGETSVYVATALRRHRVRVTLLGSWADDPPPCPLPTSTPPATRTQWSVLAQGVDLTDAEHATEAPYRPERATLFVSRLASAPAPSDPPPLPWPLGLRLDELAAMPDTVYSTGLAEASAVALLRALDAAGAPAVTLVEEDGAVFAVALRVEPPGWRTIDEALP